MIGATDLTSRYGRNQRRAAREQIATLARESERWQRQAETTGRALSTAREDGATAALKSQYMPVAIDKLMRHLADNLTPELTREAQRILDASASQRRQTSPLYMRASFDPIDATIMRIDVRVPEMRAAIALTNW